MVRKRMGYIRELSSDLERELMGIVEVFGCRGALRQHWPDTAEGLRGQKCLLDKDKGLSAHPTPHWAPSLVLASIKDKKI